MHKYTDCIVTDLVKPNADGYLRVLNKPRKLGGRLVMLHRLEIEKTMGEIPEGCEVNHKCKNRLCCNVNHLEVLTKSNHRTADNQIRYADREDEVVSFYMKNPTTTQKSLGKMFGLCQSAISKMLQRRIKPECNARS